MTYRFSTKSLQSAVSHICRYGDTDIFPHLPEIAFLREQEEDLISELKTLDLDSDTPGSAFEALVPKSRYGFRIVHQLPALDALLLLGSVIQIAPLIEAVRAPVAGIDSFSYRVLLYKKGGLFRTDRTYKDWLNAQFSTIQSDLKIKQVIATDIPAPKCLDCAMALACNRIQDIDDPRTAPESNTCSEIMSRLRRLGTG